VSVKEKQSASVNLVVCYFFSLESGR